VIKIPDPDPPKIPEFAQLIRNIDSKKADRCIIPANEINIYDAINNKLNISHISFDHTLPSNNGDLVIEDTNLQISIIASYNSNNPFIKIVGLEAAEIYILEDDTWNPVLDYILPEEFKYDNVQGLDEQKTLSESILVKIPEYEETVCSLSAKVYGGADRGFTDVWLDAVNGSDNNNGMAKTTSFKTLDKTLNLLNNTSTGDHTITVHILPGNYDYNLNALNSMNKVLFIGDIYNEGDNVYIRQDKPLIFQNSDQLSFRELKFIALNDNVLYNGLCLSFFNCDNFEVSHCNLRHSGDSLTLDNVGLLSLLNSNGAVVDSGFTYDNLQTNTNIGAGAVRVSNNAYFSWNNWDVTCNNLQYLVINVEGWFFAHRKILTNNNAVPYSCENSLGYYRCITKCPSDGSEIASFYDAIHDPDFIFSGAILTFDDSTFPTGPTEVKDAAHDTGVYAIDSADWFDPITAYIDVYSAGGLNYPIYKEGVWASDLVYTLPNETDFSHAVLTNFEEEEDFWKSIIVQSAAELTVCEKFQEVENKINKAVYSDTTVHEVVFGLEPTEAESIANPKRLYLWSSD
jgi:hypothetical protein